MIAVIFEVIPAAGRQQDYLTIAAALRKELETMDRFLSVERFASLSTPVELLSLSVFRDERQFRTGATAPRTGGRRRPGTAVAFRTTARGSPKCRAIAA